MYCTFVIHILVDGVVTDNCVFHRRQCTTTSVYVVFHYRDLRLFLLGAGKSCVRTGWFLFVQSNHTCILRQCVEQNGST